jgi:hypothetical protein
MFLLYQRRHYHHIDLVQPQEQRLNLAVFLRKVPLTGTLILDFELLPLPLPSFLDFAP